MQGGDFKQREEWQRPSHRGQVDVAPFGWPAIQEEEDELGGSNRFGQEAKMGQKWMLRPLLRIKTNFSFTQKIKDEEEKDQRRDKREK